MRVVRQSSLKRLPTALISTAVVAADQLTKNWAIDRLPDGPIEVLGGLVTFRGPFFNPGAAFSSFQGLGQAIAFLAIGIAVFLWVAAGRSTYRHELITYGLIIGGALGNGADRFFRGDGLADGAVVDFVDFASIPLFNVADASLTVGVALAIVFSFLPVARAPKEAQVGPTATEHSYENHDPPAV